MALYKCGSGYRIYDLGTAKEFDLKTLLPNVKYSNLTVNDFFIGGGQVENVTGTSSYVVVTRTLKAYSNIIKKYDASTGILTCYNEVKAENQDESWNSHWATGTFALHLYLVTKS